MGGGGGAVGCLWAARGLHVGCLWGVRGVCLGHPMLLLGCS